LALALRPLGLELVHWQEYASDVQGWLTIAGCFNLPCFT